MKSERGTHLSPRSEQIRHTRILLHNCCSTRDRSRPAARLSARNCNTLTFASVISILTAVAFIERLRRNGNYNRYRSEQSRDTSTKLCTFFLFLLRAPLDRITYVTCCEFINSTLVLCGKPPLMMYIRSVVQWSTWA